MEQLIRNNLIKSGGNSVVFVTDHSLEVANLREVFQYCAGL